MDNKDLILHLEEQMTRHVCSIIPPTLLLTILENNNTSQNTRDAVQKTYDHYCKLQQHRKVRLNACRSGATTGIPHAQGLTARGSVGQSSHRSIIPPSLFKAIADSDDTSSVQKEHAESNIKISQQIHSARSNAQHRTGTTPAAEPELAQMVRKIYDSKTSNKLRKTLIFQDQGGKATTSVTDEGAKEVLQFFEDTYQFYKEVFNRDSIDDHDLALIGSIHYDDVPGPPGMDNAFWDGDEMAFGDGDGEIFGSFTKNIDVIGHELTHGVTQYTAALEYEFQSGALNESVSDVFGTMIKQYFYAGGKQLAKDADWLIGEGIFLPTITNAKALRSMKAPGTAYDNPKVGKDSQPADMDGYANTPNTDAGDYGGVHQNSGIPNKVFYLAATAFGGYSWEKAGKIWYAALMDDGLKNIDTSAAFTIFADLTVKYAGSLFDDDAVAVMKKVWTDVKVYKAGAGDSQPKDDL
ncbi:Protease PrtS [Lachnellula suecica]|uniref:Protease PrtS n=1 Tax=Lachnellula suecica TaxID=602035 RepID=A0A8T9BVL8_9HELO|nr:Protease PrtS [Lachnellula suecica]